MNFFSRPIQRRPWARDEYGLGGPFVKGMLYWGLHARLGGLTCPFLLHGPDRDPKDLLYLWVLFIARPGSRSATPKRLEIWLQVSLLVDSLGTSFAVCLFCLRSLLTVLFWLSWLLQFSLLTGLSFAIVIDLSGSHLGC